MSRVFSVCQFTQSSVGKKALVALSGLALSGFVLMHMSGNLLLLVSAEAYNKYSHALVSNPLIYVAEVGLAAFFLGHLGLAISLTRENSCARSGGYLRSAKRKGSSFASRSMIYTGLLTLCFLVIHLKTFKYGPHYTIAYQGVEMRDIHRLVMEEFQNPLYSGWYLFSMLVLGVHLSHGIGGSLQTLGLVGSNECRVRRLSYAFAAVVVLGFMSQPIYALLRGVN